MQVSGVFRPNCSGVESDQTGVGNLRSLEWQRDNDCGRVGYGATAARDIRNAAEDALVMARLAAQEPKRDAGY
jgi:hypothetical protein